MSGPRDRATRIFYEITVDYENPTTGEPHFHYCTADKGSAQAFIFTTSELLGVPCHLAIIEWHDYDDEGPWPICRDCREARDDYARKLADELAPRRPVSAMRPPDV